MKLRHSLIIGLGLVLTSAAWAQRRDSLKVGSQAPGLDVQAWVKGEETAIESGNVYVVEFWATWCVPCKVSIPHLTDIQKKYADKGLHIIGVSNEEQDLVEPFVKQMGDQMGYTVAVDRRDSTSRAWMQAAGQTTIPTAFVVDQKGKVVFIGNPHPDADGRELERVIGRVLSGRYNPELTKQAEPMLKAAQNNRKVRNWRMADMYYDKVIDFDDAVFAEVALEKFKMHLLDMDEQEQAYDYARNELLNNRFDDDEGALVMLAELIATDPGIPDAKRDMDFALEVAQTAQSKMGRDDPEGMAMVARIHFRRGEFDQAVELQRRAYFIARPKHKDEYNRVLTAYMKASRSGEN